MFSNKNVYKNEGVDKYMSEITSRVAAESGIPSDRYHFGKLVLQSLKDDPDSVMQIDGGTGESETNGSALKRSIKCATCLKKLGLKIGDVIILMGANNLDQAIPFYAALYEGFIIAAIDKTLVLNELKATFSVDKPKVVFCQSNKVADVKKALELAELEAKIISYDSSPDSDVLTFSEMMEKYGEDIDVKDYRAADFDPTKTIACIIATSGSTGLPKAAIVTHEGITINTRNICCYTGNEFPEPKPALILSPLQWLSALIHYLAGPIFKYPRVQSSRDLDAQHVFYLINHYKPSLAVYSPPMLILLLKAAEQIKCDFTCFNVLYLGGSAVPDFLFDKLKEISPKTQVGNTYGMSELGSIAMNPFDAPLGSCGRRFAHIEYKLIDVDTQKEITEPNKVGELWLRTACGFQGYYNCPDVSAEVITPDGWYKSGDLFYFDENMYAYFVERLKLLLKYKNHQISPVELEAVIHTLPGVVNVAVSGVPDDECGELPIAFVLPRPGVSITEQEVKDVIKENLTDTKQLRGGVVFVKDLPLLPTSKVDRKQLKKIAESYAKKA
ncbi:luciferin 4-monooxygenase-like [Trichoplusia ni]|uniref:Luciferin 4-monooxygenase-like n=1 Tax=Trichoplusia ni TaxID=7111 RepID=A0A7E5VIB8_TRINI|nr:luciferin 4-monooxygenase-like [Trichoplusia ni]